MYCVIKWRRGWGGGGGGCFHSGISLWPFFGNVLIQWGYRFWPWVLPAKHFQSRLLFSISLCLWDVQVHQVSGKVPAPACKHWNAVIQPHPASFRPWPLPPPPLEDIQSTSRGHLCDLCATSHMQTTYCTVTVCTVRKCSHHNTEFDCHRVKERERGGVWVFPEFYTLDLKFKISTWRSFLRSLELLAVKCGDITFLVWREFHNP